MYGVLSLLIAFPDLPAEAPLSAYAALAPRRALQGLPRIRNAPYAIEDTVLQDGRVILHAGEAELSAHERAALHRPDPSRFAAARFHALASLASDMAHHASGALQDLRAEFRGLDRGDGLHWTTTHPDLDGAAARVIGLIRRAHDQPAAPESEWLARLIAEETSCLDAASYFPFTRHLAASFGGWRAFDLRPDPALDEGLAVVFVHVPT